MIDKVKKCLTCFRPAEIDSNYCKFHLPNHGKQIRALDASFRCCHINRNHAKKEKKQIMKMRIMKQMNKK
jgi:hypothetical protein